MRMHSREMRIVFILLILVPFMHGQEEFSIEAFWLGELRYHDEMMLSSESKRQLSELRSDESRFLNEDDVLWDVKAHYQEKGFDLEKGWAVYNETTGYLVVKSHVLDLWAFSRRHGIENFPAIVNLVVDVFEVNSFPAEWVDWETSWSNEAAEQVMSVELSGRSGETFTQSWRESEVRTLIEVQPNLSYSFEEIDLRLALEMTLGEQEYLLHTGLTLIPSQTIFLELGHLGGSKNRVLRLTANPLLVGGPLVTEWHLSEQGGKSFSAGVVKESKYGDFEIPTEGKSRMIAWGTPRTFCDDISGVELLEEAPFATDEPSKKDFNSRMEVVKNVPLALSRAFAEEEWFNFTRVFQDTGLELKGNSFAYHAKNQSLLVVQSDNELDFEFVEQITATLGPGVISNFQIACSVITENEAGKREVVAKAVVPTRLGEVGSLFQRRDSLAWDVEFQPTMGASDVLVDLRYAVKLAGKINFENISATTLLRGKPQEILLQKRNGESVLLRLQAVRVEHAGQVTEGWLD